MGLKFYLEYRYHVVEEFNKGVYDYIIASDENAGRSEQDPDNSEEGEDDDDDDEDENCKVSLACEGASY